MSKFVGFKSVVGRITMAFVIMLPILAYALGSATYDAVTSYRDAGMIDRQNAAANNLIAGVYEILMERLATNNALQANDPAGGDVLKEIDVRRSVAVKKIGAAFEDLGAQDFPAKAALLAELKGAIEKANGYRSKADAAIKQPKAARDADTVKNLFVSLSELSTTSQKVWAAVLSNTSRLDPELARLSNIRILAWNLRDTAGFERSHIAQSISAKSAIPADKLVAISEIRAQLATMWKLLNISLREKELAGVTKGVQSAKDGYYAKFQPLADEMRKVSANGAAYPMSTQQWVDTTTPLLFTLLDIMYGAGEASEAYTANLHSAVLVKLGLSLGLLALGIVVAAGAIAFAYRTVAKPIGELSGVVGDLTATDKEVTVPHLTRVDEIGHMARSLQSFRQGHVDMETFRREQQQRERAARAARRAARQAHGGFRAAHRRDRGHGHHGSDAARSGRRHAHPHRRIRTAALRHGRGRVGGSVIQRAVRGVRHRGNDLVGERDRPASARIEQDRVAKRSPRPRGPTRASRRCRRRRAASATWSS